LSAVARDARDPAIAARVGAARDAAEELLEEVRGLSRSVHPAVLDDLGLEAALNRLARDAKTGNAIDFDVDARLGNVRLPRSVEGALYRVAEEAVRNATRHAAPARVAISVRHLAPCVVLEVHDDGRGFVVNHSASPDGETGRGIPSMRERLSLVDGSLEVKSTPRDGTTVTAIVPLDSRNDTPRTFDREAP